MSNVTLFGAAYSVYVRIVRLVLKELGVPYRLTEVDIFAKEGVPAEQRARHPFGRIPAFEHDGFHLYETDAIVGYIVERFDGNRLLPAEVRERTRMRQIMRIMDNYAYRALIWGVYVEEMERGRAGRLEPQELERARRCLEALEDLAAPVFLAGAYPTLADLWVLPMLFYFRLAPSGAVILGEHPKLGAWLERMRDRPSVQTTRFRAETAAA
jgi:glutathione S-transferase